MHILGTEPSSVIQINANYWHVQKDNNGAWSPE